MLYPESEDTFIAKEGVMGLSDYEKQVLADLEAQLREGDPSFDAAMAKEAPNSPRKTPPRVMAAMGVVTLLGLVIIVVAVSLGYTWPAMALAVVGCLVMVFGITLPWNRKVVAKLSGKTARGASSSAFMKKQQQKWERRGQGESGRY